MASSMTARTTKGTTAKTLVVDPGSSDDLEGPFWRWMCFACTMFWCWIFGGFGSGSIPRSLNCLMAYQQRKKKQLCKVSFCLFLSGIVNSICALFVTRCSPLRNPGGSHPEWTLASLSTGTISLYEAKRPLKLIASKSGSKCYLYFIKHL